MRVAKDGGCDASPDRSEAVFSEGLGVFSALSLHNNIGKSDSKPISLPEPSSHSPSMLELLPRELRNQIYWHLGLDTKIGDADFHGQKIRCRHVLESVNWSNYKGVRIWTAESWNYYINHTPRTNEEEPMPPVTRCEALDGILKTNKLFREEISDLAFGNSLLVLSLCQDFVRNPRDFEYFVSGNRVLPPKFPLTKIKTVLIRSEPIDERPSFRALYCYHNAISTIAQRKNTVEKLVLIPPRIDEDQVSDGEANDFKENSTDEVKALVVGCLLLPKLRNVIIQHPDGARWDRVMKTSAERAVGQSSLVFDVSNRVPSKRKVRRLASEIHSMYLECFLSKIVMKRSPVV